MSEASESRRIDQWLWFARFFKTRTLATRYVERGRIRLKRFGEQHFVRRANFEVRPGDILTFAVGTSVKVIKIRGIGQRRGPVSEAQMLYCDLEGDQNAP